MKPPKETEAPLTAAEALKEEFLKLHGPPSDSYHQWLDRLPAEPKLWLLLPDHLTETPKFLEKLRLPADAFAQFVRSQLSPRTTGLLDRCAEEECSSDKMIEALSADLNQLITSGQSIYETDRFAHLHLTPETTALLQQKRDGQKFDILNRLLLEEAFPEHLLKVWDTLGGVFALMHTRDRTALCFSGGGIRSATFALGVAQGLAQHGLLDKFDYLSTVSGGGYIGSC